MGKIKLYDVENYEYPNLSDVDAEFFTKQRFKCSICGALTNRVTRRNDSSLGVKPICPNHLLYHHEIARRKNVLNSELHPEFYHTAMLKEINDIRQGFFNDLQNDLVGWPDKGKIFYFE